MQTQYGNSSENVIFLNPASCSIEEISALENLFSRRVPNLSKASVCIK